VTDQRPFMKSYVLALDLEGTLISNAMSQIPWPGLAGFLNRCAELFPRIVMFTPLSRKNGSGRSRAYWWTRASRPPGLRKWNTSLGKARQKTFGLSLAYIHIKYCRSMTLRSTFISAKKHSGCKLSTLTIPTVQRIPASPTCSTHWRRVFDR